MATPKRLGRPPLDPTGGASASIHLKVVSSDYARLDKHARQQGSSIQDVIRRSLKHLLKDERG